MGKREFEHAAERPTGSAPPPHPVIGRRGLLAALLALLLALVGLRLEPAAVDAAPCSGCTLYAYTDLNMRKGPSLQDAILTVVPRGAPVVTGAAADRNGYAFVTYNGFAGWVVSLGLVASPSEVQPITTATTTPRATTTPTMPAPTPSPDETAGPIANDDERVTLTPLVLRSGPEPDAEAILIMPAGADVQLTAEGAENGYVTVVYNGTVGWAYADLLGGDAGA